MTLIFFQVDLGSKSKQCDGSVTGSRFWGSATAAGKRGLTADVQEASLEASTEDSQSRAPILGPECPQCSSPGGAWTGRAWSGHVGRERSRHLRRENGGCRGTHGDALGYHRPSVQSLP